MANLNEPSERDFEILHLVEEVSRRWARGESFELAEIIEKHPELMPELGTALEKARREKELGSDQRLIDAARAVADDIETIDTGFTIPITTVEAESIEIEGYQIIGEIHRGGQAIVYQGIQKSTKSKVAIKVLLHGKYASASAKKRFEREIELVAQLKHPNIIRIFDSGVTSDGYDYCVMEYIRGRPLHDYVHENRLKLDEALDLFARVCDAVQYAHLRGVIHRDLKPSNILVGADGHPRVLDFGLAKQLAEPIESLVSITGQVLGTLPYMSPEQAGGNPDKIDARTDVYSLGVILYEILTGHYPYPVVGTVAEVLKNISETPPTPPSRQWTPGEGVAAGQRSSKRCPIKDDVQTIVLKSLEKSPKRRFQSADALAENVRRYLRGEPIDDKRDKIFYLLRLYFAKHKRRIGPVIGVLGLIGIAWTSFETVNRIRAAKIQAIVDTAVHHNRWNSFPKAIEQYRLVLEQDPTHKNALYSLSVIHKDLYTNSGEQESDLPLLKEADKYAALAVQHYPDHAGILNLRCEVSRLLGKLDEAESAGISSDKNGEGQALHANALSNLAKVRALKGDFDEALLDVVRGTVAAKDLVGGGIQPWYAGVWRTRGMLELHLGHANALESFEAAVECNREDPRSYLVRAKAKLRNGDWSGTVDDAAVSYYGTHPRDFRSMTTLATALVRQGDYERANRFAHEAIDLDEGDAAACLLAAITTSKSGDKQQARVLFQRAEANWPQDPEGRGYLVNVHRGVLWFDSITELEELKKQARAVINDG